MTKHCLLVKNNVELAKTYYALPFFTTPYLTAAAAHTWAEIKL